MNFAAWLMEADRQIRIGQTGQVLKQLQKIARADIPREQVIEFAKIALRLGQNYWGILLLNKFVRPKTPIQIPANDSELAVYAAFLGRIGAISESENILRSLKGCSLAEVSLYRAQNQVLCWNYSRAIPFFERYLRFSNLTNYQKLVGELNLAASQVVVGDYQKAENSLLKLSAEFTHLGYDLLAGNSEELLGQLSIFRQTFNRADIHLNFATQKLKDSPPRYMYYVKKWRLIADLMQSKDLSGERSKLINLKNQSSLYKEWESYRDCEFFEAIIFKDNSLLQKVLWGTPYAEYRKTRKNLFCNNFKFTNYHDLLPAIHSESSAILDLQAASLLNVDSPLSHSISHLPLMLLRFLTRDFYKPAYLGQIHAALYPNEIFDPHSSPGRINFHLEKLREWINVNSLGLRVEVNNRSYKLVLQPGFKIRLRKRYKKLVPAKLLNFRGIKAKSLAAKFNISERHARRLISRFKLAR